jgi:hypothetical protein
MTGLGIDGGDDPIRGGALKDPEAPVGGLFDVLTGDGGQQRRRLDHSWGQPLAPQPIVGPVGVADQRVHQHLAGSTVGPVTGRLARRPVIVVSLQQPPDLGLQLRRAGPQQPPDRAPDHRDRVLGGDRVLQRGRVQHPLDPHQPHLAGQLAGDPEDPIRIGRAAQPGPQIDQHGVGEAGRLLPGHPISHPGGVPPADVEGEPVGRLSVRQPFQPLQDHHHGQDRGRHRPATGRLEQVGEQLGWEQPGSLPGQKPVDRSLGQGRLTPASTNGGQLRAAQLTAKGHNSSSRLDNGARSLPAQPATDESDTEHRPPSQRLRAVTSGQRRLVEVGLTWPFGVGAGAALPRSSVFQARAMGHGRRR